MDCPFCSHTKSHKHGRTKKGRQRFKCPACNNTFTETFDTLCYRRQLSPDEVQSILRFRLEGSSLRGISRISQRSYNTVMSVVHQAAQKAKMIQNQENQIAEVHDAIINDFQCLASKPEMHNSVDNISRLSSIDFATGSSVPSSSHVMSQTNSLADNP